MCLVKQFVHYCLLLLFADMPTSEMVRLNLEQQLQINLRKIIDQRASYVKCIRRSLKSKGVTAEELCTDLLFLPAFYPHAEKKCPLLGDLRTRFKETTTIDGVFSILSGVCFFYDCHIFQSIVKDYGLDQGQEELKYPEYLKAYMKRHKVSEFIHINPSLEKFADSSNPLYLKFDIKSTCTLHDLDKLKHSVAEILGLETAVLRLLDINEGCITTTYLISPSIADAIFTSDKKFTAKETEEFQALSVEWLKYGERTFTFGDGAAPEGEKINIACTTYWL